MTPLERFKLSHYLFSARNCYEILDWRLIYSGNQESRRRGGEKTSRPTEPCDGPRMNRRKTCGNPPRPFRRLRVTEHGTPDLSKRVGPPFIQVLVQKSVTAITNEAGRLSIVDARQNPEDSQVGPSK